MALISKKRANEIAEKAESRGNNAQKNLPVGVHEMRMTEVSGQLRKKDNVPMVKLTVVDVAGEYSPITEYFSIDEGPGADILASRLKAVGAHNFGEIETLEDLVKHVARNLKGKTFNAAIRHEQRIYRKTPTEWFLNTDARLAYTGPVGEDLFFDESKAVKQLDPVEQKMWDEYVSGSGDRKPSVKQQDEADDLSILDTVPEKAQAVKEEPEAPKPAKATPKTAKAEVTKEETEEDDDELSFLNE